MTSRPGMLARGPWRPEQVEARWRDDPYEPPAELARQADEAVDVLRERGSPSHDGMATRLFSWGEDDDRLRLELQPVRWALRLIEGGACDSLTALCVVRSADGRWLAGRRAGWVSQWPNRWALGAGGAVDLGESPALTLAHGSNQRIERRTFDAPAEHPLREGTGQLSGSVAVLGVPSALKVTITLPAESVGGS